MVIGAYIGEMMPAPDAEPMKVGPVAMQLDRAIGFLYLLIGISLPFSLRLYFSAIDLEIIFPAEPLIGLLAVASFARVITQQGWRRMDRSVLRDPMVVLVLAWLIVLAASVVFSAFLMASLKALLVRTTFIVVFFLLPLLFPHSIVMDRQRVLLLHAMAFTAIIAYSFIRQSEMGYDRNGSALAPFPFYVDHTSYAAALVFVLLFFGAELMISMIKGKRTPDLDLSLLFTLCVVALYFAYCRAAWASMIVVLLQLAVLRLRVPVRWLTVGFGLSCLPLVFLAISVLAGQGAVIADSNATGAGFKESVLSLTNVHTDASNKERLNRWKCAVRMFKDAPILGHGVGSYQFAFPPYQLKEEMTYISVTGPVDPVRVQRIWSLSDDLFVRRNPQNYYCSGGTAHSEYLLALSESGLFAGLLLVGLFVAAFGRGMSLAYTMVERITRIRVVMAWLAVTAYFIHALFNNYLDDPKVAFLFWVTLGILVDHRKDPVNVAKAN